MTPEITEAFYKSVTRYNSLLTSLKHLDNEWQFMKIALSYLLKSSFTTNGAEKLLWNIAILEALFGRRNENIINKVAERTSKILGNTKNEIKEIKKEIKNLYDIRSRTVHGDKEILKPIYAKEVLKSNSHQPSSLNQEEYRMAG